MIYSCLLRSWIPRQIVISLCGTLFYLASASGSADAKGGSIPVDVELVFAVDISYSMDPDEQKLQREGYAAALTSPAFLEALKTGATRKVVVAYMQWSSFDDQNIVLNWTLIDDPNSAQTAADKLLAAPLRRATRTSISAGIDFAVKMFEGNGYDSPRQIIDVSGDGPNNSGRKVTDARDDAVAKGFTINGLPLVGVRPFPSPADIKDLDVYYRDCVIGGPGAFMIPIRNMSALVQTTRTKIVQEIVGQPPHSLIVPVQAEAPAVSCTIGEDGFPEGSE